MNNTRKRIQKQQSRGLKTACFLNTANYMGIPCCQMALKWLLLSKLWTKPLLWDCKTKTTQKLKKKNACRSTIAATTGMNEDLEALCWWFHAAPTTNSVPCTSHSITIILTHAATFEMLHGPLRSSSRVNSCVTIKEKKTFIYTTDPAGDGSKTMLRFAWIHPSIIWLAVVP